MAIATDSYQNIEYNGNTVSQIGLSKTLDNYTWDEIFNFQYCSMSNRLNRIVTLKTAVNMENSLVETVVPLTINNFTTSSLGYHFADMVADRPGEYIYPDGMYCKILWLQGTRSASINYGIYNSNKSNFKIVTEWDAPKFIYNLPDPQNTIGDCATSWSDSESDVKTTWSTMAEFGSLSYRYVHDGTHTDISIANDIYPYIMFQYNGHYYLHQLRQSTYQWTGTVDRSDSKSTGGDWLYSIEDETVYSLAFTGGNVSADGIYTDSARATTPQNPYNYRYDSTSATDVYANADNNDCMFKIRYGTTSPSRQLTVTSYFRSKHSSLLFWAGCGVKFYADKLYKPIISDGYVTDYTDDMTTPSELDNWSGDSNHTVPDAPPSPGPGPGPYDDDPWSGATFSGVGVGGAGAFAKCYYMTSTELANLRTWMNSNNVPEGFDPMAQIIGLSQVPVSLSGDDNTTVQFVNSSAVYDPGVTRLVDSGVSTQIAMGTPKRYSLGSVDIVRRMQERGEPYLDYDCQIELYLPLIGMFSLDTQAVMGRTITAEAVLDPISGTLAAYAYVSRDGQNLPIAYGSTTIGVDLPITAQQYSVARAALKQANAQLGTSLLSSTLSLIAAATAGGKGSGTGAKTATGSKNGLAAAGIREAGADYMKASQAGNVFGDFMQWGRTIRQLSYGNNTAVAGSFGGSTAQWAYPFTPYVKIIRPRYEKPSNYNHSQGVPCVQAKTVGSCSGFIQCVGVDVSGITGATDIELQAIQAALSNGVFAGGGS